MLFGSIDAAINAGFTLQTIANPEANVRQLLMFPQVGRMLKDNNLDIINVLPAAKNKKYLLFSPISLIIKFIINFIPSARKKHQYLEYTNSNAVLIGGDYVLVETRKL